MNQEQATEIHAPGYSGQSMKLTHPLHLMPMLRLSRAIPSPLHTFTWDVLNEVWGQLFQKPFQILILVSSPTMPIQVVNICVHKLHANVNHIQTPTEMMS